MKKYIFIVVILFIGMVSVSSAQERRILVLNECMKYNLDLGEFLPLISTHWGHDDRCDHIAPIESYFYMKGNYSKNKYKIKNNKAAYAVAYEMSKRLQENYDIVILPLLSELKSMRRQYRHHPSEWRRKNSFRSFAASYYDVDTIVVLTQSLFDMQLTSRKEQRIAHGTVSLSCKNHWEVFCAQDNKVVKSFSTTGSATKQWNDITGKEARKKAVVSQFLSNSNYSRFDRFSNDFSKIRNADPFPLIPVISDAAIDAAGKVPSI